MAPGDIVRDLVGLRGVVLGSLGDLVRVQWADRATWVRRKYLRVIIQ